jgi:hypothetical protein
MRAVRPARMTPCAWLLAVAVTAALIAAAAAGCTSPAVRSRSYGPVVTLRIGVYGAPGYQQSGLYREYEKLHPNIKIVQTATGSQASYWRALRAHLASGTGLDDIQAVPLDEISTITARAAAGFVPLNMLPYVERQEGARGAGQPQRQPGASRCGCRARPGGERHGHARGSMAGGAQGGRRGGPGQLRLRARGGAREWHFLKGSLNKPCKSAAHRPFPSRRDVGELTMRPNPEAPAQPRLAPGFAPAGWLIRAAAPTSQGGEDEDARTAPTVP